MLDSYCVVAQTIIVCIIDNHSLQDTEAPVRLTAPTLKSRHVCLTHLQC